VVVAAAVAVVVVVVVVVAQVPEVLSHTAGNQFDIQYHETRHYFRRQ